MSNEDLEPTDDDLANVVQLAGRRRPSLSSGRPLRVNARFFPEELTVIEAAAASLGMTTTGFCAHATVAVARSESLSSGSKQDRESLARLQRELFAVRTAINRVGANLNQAVAAFNATGEGPLWLGQAVAICVRSVQAVDSLASEVHRLLR